MHLDGILHPVNARDATTADLFMVPHPSLSLALRRFLASCSFRRIHPTPSFTRPASLHGPRALLVRNCPFQLGKTKRCFRLLAR